MNLSSINGFHEREFRERYCVARLACRNKVFLYQCCIRESIGVQCLFPAWFAKVIYSLNQCHCARLWDLVVPASASLCLMSPRYCLLRPILNPGSGCRPSGLGGDLIQTASEIPMPFFFACFLLRAFIGFPVWLALVIHVRHSNFAHVIRENVHALLADEVRTG